MRQMFRLTRGWAVFVFPIAFELVLSAQQVNYTPYAFTTIAGMASIGGEDGDGSAARFAYPRSVAVNSAGDIFVADTINDTIRELVRNGSAWSVTTIAGAAGSPGFADGRGANARFSSPEGLGIDGAGALYVGDSGNNCVRRMTFDGSVWNVTTIVGRPGVYGDLDGTNQNAYLNDPVSICVDASGHVFFTDYGNNEVREITTSGTNWILKTIAGQGALASGHADGMDTNATFYFPNGITVDKSGNLFVSDGLNYTIRKLTPSGSHWITSTIAGQVGVDDGGDGLGTNAQFEFPAGLAVATNGNIFVADAEDYAIRELSPSGTNYAVTTILGRQRVAGTNDGGNDNARFYSPFDVALDHQGNLIIADTDNSEIREASPSGTNWISTTLAGFGGDTGNVDGVNGTARFNQPFGIAVDSNTNLYVADNFNSTIRKLTPSGTNWTVTTIAGQAGYANIADGSGTNAMFSYPDGIAVDANGVVYVADSGNGIIRRLALKSGSYDTVTIAGTNGPRGSQDGLNSSAQFNNPSGIAVDTFGNLYVADCFNSTIREISAIGTNWLTTTIAGAAGSDSWADGNGTNALFNNPRGVAVDKNGVVYVTDWGNYLIRMLTPGPGGYAVSTIAGRLQVYGHADGTNSDSSFAYPTHIAVDSNGILYVTDCNNSTIRKITPRGTNWVVTTLGGVPNQVGSADGLGPAALFNYPEGISVDGNGVIYVTEEFNMTVRRGVATPVVLMTQPVISSGHLELPFLLESGSAAQFMLLQTPHLGSPWATNAAAVLSAITPGVSYKFTVSLPATPEFFIIRVP